MTEFRKNSQENKFFFLPKTINNETRWLRRAAWIEAYMYYRTADSVEGRWVPIGWADDEEKGEAR